MRNIKIGDTPLVGISEEDLKQIVMIEGCCCSLEYWHEPIVTGIDSTMFSDKTVLDYHSLRISDGYKSSDFTFFLNTDSFSYHHCKDLYNSPLTRSAEGRRLGIKSLAFLIKQGYNIPL